MPTIDQPPQAVTDGGQTHEYTAPPETCRLVLVNMPADPDHMNVGLNKAAYDTFIENELAAHRAWDSAVEIGLNLVMYDPEYSPILPIDYETALTYYNYGRLTIGTRDWYVFYTPSYANKEQTRFNADLDEFPSFTWQLGYSPIERGHIAVAAALDDPYGNDYLTAPEPEDAPPVRGVIAADLLASDPDSWTVLVVSANDLRGQIDDTPFFQLHVEADNIRDAGGIASSATIDSSDTVQATIPDADYPWSTTGDGSGTDPIGTPKNGYVPAAYLTELAGSPPGKAPGHLPTVEAELNTAAAYAALHAANPHSSITGPAGGYWNRALDQAIHADPGAYDVIDTGLSPIGASPHGLGIRLNIGGVDVATILSFGFTEYNEYTFTWPGPYSWDETPPTPELDVYVPVVKTSKVSTIDGVAAGGGVYLFTLAGFAEYMTIMQGAPWVTQGIMDVRFVPSWAVSGGGDATFDSDTPSRDPTDASWSNVANIPSFVEEVVSGTASATVIANWRAAALAAAHGGNWTKLLTSQFTDIILNNGEGQVSFRPDQWETDDIAFTGSTGAAHGEATIRAVPVSYNHLGRTVGLEVPVGGKAGLTHSGFGIAASNPGAQDVSLYLNAFSSKANWASNLRNKALAETLTLDGIQMQSGIQGVQTALGGATKAAGGALGGGVVGARGAVAGAALGEVGNLATAQMSATMAITLLDVRQDGAFDIAALQLALSSQAAYQSFESWYQSLFAVSGGGTPSSLASAWRAVLGQSFQAVVVMPSQERVNKLVSSWHRYGYMIGQVFTPPRLDVMTRFSYWKTSGAVITGAAPQMHRQTIAAAFDRGVTVYNDLSRIGFDPGSGNTPLPGISY